MGYIDLSHQINDDTPVYPGDPKVKIEAAGVLSSDGFADSMLTMGTHVGTHIDAPAHMITDGKTLNQYPVSRLVGTAIVLDIHMDIQMYIQKLTDIDAVFFYTGASERFHEESYWTDYDVLPKETLATLIKLSPSIVGVDTGSVDNTDGFPIHKELLENDILILENLTSLKTLIGKTFSFTALPLNVALDGAPCRVIAEV